VKYSGRVSINVTDTDDKIIGNMKLGIEIVKPVYWKNASRLKTYEHDIVNGFV